MIRITLLLFAVLALCASRGAGADAVAIAPADPVTKPFLASVFTSNMVLQRNMLNPVWGWTTPGAKVTVEIADTHVSATAGRDGAWTVLLNKLPVGGPYQMDVSGPDDVTLYNVMVGDVWICSGQSNMEVGLSAANNYQQEVAAANYPELRIFKVKYAWATDPRKTIDDARWVVCSPRTVDGNSAIGYFFARDLHNELKIPIGLIDTDWGGTTAEAWVSAEALSKIPDFSRYLRYFDDVRKGIRTSDYDRLINEWCARNDTQHSDYAAVACDDSSWKTMSLPCFWQDAGLHDYAGIVWFRRSIDIPESAAGKNAVLHLGTVYDADSTTVNGVKVGGSANFKYNALSFGAPRDYNVPGSLLHAGANIIAIRVLDTTTWCGGLSGKAEQMRLSLGDKSSIDLAGVWKYCPTLPLGSVSERLPARSDDDVHATSPTTLFNAMISPLIPYGITGVIWYQGESNASRAYQYRTLLPDLIGDWRSRWCQGDFPYYIVQLANYGDPPKQPVDDTWAELREAQTMTASSVPNSGLATAIDIGEARSIHPKNKQEVGRRLMLVALAKHYHQNVVCSGPIYRTMLVEGRSIRLRFDHIEGGLQIHGDKLTGMAITGADHHFVWADAKIDGDTVLVSATTIDKPIAVRYGWAMNPECNLFNQAGLPAVPFRTDQWPGITAPKTVSTTGLSRP